MPFCRNCGTEHPEDANFCRNCGEQLKFDNTSYNIRNFGNNSYSSTKYTIFMIISIFYPLILFVIFIKSDYIISIKDVISYRYSMWDLITDKFHANPIIMENLKLSRNIGTDKSISKWYFYISVILLLLYYIFFISNQFKNEMDYSIFQFFITFFINLSYFVVPSLIKVSNTESEYSFTSTAVYDFSPFLLFIIGLSLEITRIIIFKKIKKDYNQTIEQQKLISSKYSTFSFEREMVNENITDIDIPIDKQ